MISVIFRPLCLICAFIFLLSSPIRSWAQPGKSYWQQEIKYKMDVKMNVQTNQFVGNQIMRYRNNSPDILDRVYFHLYFNAFQPGSAMDVRSRTIKDPDPRVADRILNLKADEIGYQRIKKLTQNGKSLKYDVEGTILEVMLAKPLRPGQSATFEMDYEAQVPLQVRRSGRDNKEGIRFSMAQWYPKMCEYDEQGWHAHPYVGREFYGVWGDFDVSIQIDPEYVVAASGVLQNSKNMGHGYGPETNQTLGQQTQQLVWRFIAEDVHDFVWAADPDYTHRIHTCKDGLVIHTFFEETEEYKANWEALPAIMEEAFSYINTHFGKYPYPVYSFIQGGDGGMEYPMATLITGKRPLNSLVGVSVHELLHSWYQMVLGFDESHYYWMDEGFTDYAETRVTDHLRSKGLIPGETKEFLYENTYSTYKGLVERGIEEPLTTHADHFDFNSAYSISAYIKGAVFLHQLEYVIGKPALDKGLLDFYNTWKFKHPDANDFIRIMEKTSDLELDWYKEYMVYSTKTTDYSVDTIFTKNDRTIVGLRREGKMPMPVDVVVQLKNGSSTTYNIPLDLMRGAKMEILKENNRFIVLPDWDWVNPYYEMELPSTMIDIESISIDPSLRLADMNRTNNQWPVPKP